MENSRASPFVIAPLQKFGRGGGFKSQIWAETIPKLPNPAALLGAPLPASTHLFSLPSYRVTWICFNAQKGFEGGQRERENSGRFSGNSKFFFTEIGIIWQPTVKYFWVPEESQGGKKQAREGKMLMNRRGEKNKVEKKRKTNESK